MILSSASVEAIRAALAAGPEPSTDFEPEPAAVDPRRLPSCFPHGAAWEITPENAGRWYFEWLPASEGRIQESEELFLLRLDLLHFQQRHTGADTPVDALLAALCAHLLPGRETWGTHG